MLAKLLKVPRDSMTSLIQQIARKASVTFKNCGSANGDNEVFLGNQGELSNLLNEIRAADLKITPRKIKSSSKSQSHSPPVTYMHICETEDFSMGVFLLKPGASIPLHDHPGMNGLLKVLYGKVRIRCLDKLDNPPGAESEIQFNPPLLPNQKEALRRSIQRSIGEYTEESSPCILTPLKDNLHQIDAVDGPAAFLDVLAPPMTPMTGETAIITKFFRQFQDNRSKKMYGFLKFHSLIISGVVVNPILAQWFLFRQIKKKKKKKKDELILKRSVTDAFGFINSGYGV